MSEAKFTPGPWWPVRLDGGPRGSGAQWIIRARNNKIVVAGLPAGTVDNHELAANVRVMAAAPDLYEACKLALNEMRAWQGECEHDATDLMYPVFTALREAIARSEGGPQ